jgi:hypothetical protein
MRRRRLLAATLAAPALALPARAQGFDHTHAAWDALLRRHVVLLAGGSASQVDYDAFARERDALRRYLAELSAVGADAYARWSRPQQFAFLANAYNAFTIEKVLMRWPDLKSIRDFGSFIGNPWKDRFFTLLGRPQHLDGIEHDTLRARGVFDEPRVHVAVNCASVGCPLLAPQAFTAERLDAQLEDLMRRFLSDRTRNRYNPAGGALELSKIFDWYRSDFETGGRSFLGYEGLRGVPDVGARYADLLADDPADRARLRARQAPVRFLDYDWALNRRP